MLTGLGIYLSRHVQDLLQVIDDQDQSHVIQKYIERPLLIPDNNRKFDIRLWVILDHLYNIYIYKEGVVRTCSGRQSYIVVCVPRISHH